jgi:hypothetical protein
MTKILVLVAIGLVLLLIFKAPMSAATDAHALFSVIGRGADSLITFINLL